MPRRCKKHKRRYRSNRADKQSKCYSVYNQKPNIINKHKNNNIQRAQKNQHKYYHLSTDRKGPYTPKTQKYSTRSKTEEEEQNQYIDCILNMRFNKRMLPKQLKQHQCQKEITIRISNNTIPNKTEAHREWRIKIRININPSTTAHTLITEICNQCNIEPFEFQIFCYLYDWAINAQCMKRMNLSQLNQNQRLIEYGITYKNQFYLEWTTINLYLRINNTKTVQLTDIKHRDIITSVLAKYCDKLNNCWDIDCIKYRLSYKNQLFRKYDMRYSSVHNKTITANSTLCLDLMLEISAPKELTTITVEIERETTVNDLRCYISMKRNLHLYEFKIKAKKRGSRYYHYRYLFGSNWDGSVLDDDEIYPNPTDNVLDIVSKKYSKWELEWSSTNIYIEITSKLIPLNGVKFNDTIASIKRKYSALCGISHTKYRLLYNNKVLHDNETLHDYDIEPDSKLKLLNQLSIKTAFDLNIDYNADYKLTQILDANNAMVQNLETGEEETYHISKIKHLLSKSASNESIYIKIDPLATIAELKHMIGNKIAIDVNTFALCKIKHSNQIKNEYLRDNQTLDGYRIHDETVLYLIHIHPELMMKRLKKYSPIWNSTTIRLKSLGGNDIVTEVRGVTNDTTVYFLKLQIEKRLRYYHLSQTLIYEGWELNNKYTMKQLRIRQNATICIMIKSDVYLHELLIDGLISETDFEQKIDDPVVSIRELFINTSKDSMALKSIYKITKNVEINKMIFDGLLSIKKNKNEGMLFHGTSLENIIKIINTGFNRDFNRRSVYGKGTYYSNKAWISDYYCPRWRLIDNENIYVMLSCRTYIGQSTIGNAAMSQCDLYKQDTMIQYDSLVNDMDDPEIFVINRDYHSFPCYVIVYTK